MAALDEHPKFDDYPLRVFAGLIFTAVALFIYSRRDNMRLTFDPQVDRYDFSTKNWWREKTISADRIGGNLKVDIREVIQSFRGASITWNIIILHRGDKTDSIDTIGYGSAEKAAKAKSKIEHFLTSNPIGPMTISETESSMIAVCAYALLGFAFLTFGLLT